MVSLTTGCIAGGIECVSVWPMEYIKTQLQLQRVGVPQPFNGVVSGLVYTVRSTGFLSLYNGLGVTLVGSIPKAGIRFGGNDFCKNLLKGMYISIASIRDINTVTNIIHHYTYDRREW